MNLEGKVCLVTGGARGIGRAIVEAYAAAGARAVYAGDLAFDGFDEVERQYPAVKRIDLNVTNRESSEAAVSRIVTDEGGLDVLVNNAGITRDGLVQKMSDDDWDAVINVNLKGVFVMTRAVLPTMLDANAGVVISMSSVVGLDGNIGQSNYAATKGGVVSMTRTWAKEFARKGAQIRVNAIAPGFIRTPMTETVPQKVLDLMVSKTPLGRMGEAADIANAATFLASDAASFVTGQVLRVDGGLVF
ncbi:MAG: 3-oxoacyl-ACP reductase FabG [Spirochaeta sp.]|jgi:3-oxoacyl-[acyl-carrier protein] reductase|nr:3-oxoacyl-ACP reductase FabG [Spirochaeta sp.]